MSVDRIQVEVFPSEMPRQGASVKSSWRHFITRAWQSASFWPLPVSCDHECSLSCNSLLHIHSVTCIQGISGGCPVQPWSSPVEAPPGHRADSCLDQGHFSGTSERWRPDSFGLFLFSQVYMHFNLLLSDIKPSFMTSKWNSVQCLLPCLLLDDSHFIWGSIHSSVAHLLFQRDYSLMSAEH